MADSAPLRVILQARTDSARLPAKSLLPIAGYPLAILAAKRLANAGADVVLATSDRAVDDQLVQAAARERIKTFRGSASDVLKRFAAACADLPDDALVVRATGDNPVPDGMMVESIEAAMREGTADIVGIRWPGSGLPYGISLEGFRVGTLRDAERDAKDGADREHVTPYTWRTRRGADVTRGDNASDTSGLRATIDTLGDYVRMAEVFSSVADPVREPAQQIVARLLRSNPMAKPPRIRKGQVHHAFVLGTAQLGLDYGRGPEREAPTAVEACRIIDAAIERGVTHLDTARAYGCSENRVRDALRGGGDSRISVITKLSPMPELPTGAAPATVDAHVDASVFCSLATLGLTHPPTLLLHRAEHRLQHEGRIWLRLRMHRAEGRVAALGVSVSTPDELREAAGDLDVSLIQFPCNIVDRRWDAALEFAYNRRGDSLLLHARSALLQGLLVQPDDREWPAIADVDPSSVRSYLERLRDDLGRQSVADLCFAYLRAHPRIDGVVVGTPSLRALRNSLDLFELSPLDADAFTDVAGSRPVLPAAFLDPSQWPRRTTSP